MTPADCLEKIPDQGYHEGSQAGPAGIADLRRQLKDQGGRVQRHRKRELHRGKPDI